MYLIMKSSPATVLQESGQQMIEVHIGKVGNDFPEQSSVENTIVNNEHTNCNTTI